MTSITFSILVFIFFSYPVAIANLPFQREADLYIIQTPPVDRSTKFFWPTTSDRTIFLATYVTKHQYILSTAVLRPKHVVVAVHKVAAMLHTAILTM